MALNRIMIWQREGLLSEEWGLEGVEEEEGVGMEEKRRESEKEDSQNEGKDFIFFRFCKTWREEK